MWMVLWYLSVCISISQTFTIAGNPPSPGMLDWGRWLLRWSEKPDIAVWTVALHRVKGWWINKLLIVFRCFHSSQELTFRFDGWSWVFSMFDQIPNSDRSMSRRWMAHGRWIFIPLCLYDQDQWRAINAFDHVWDGCQSCDFHHRHPHPHPRRRLPFWFKDPIPNSMVQFFLANWILIGKVFYRQPKSESPTGLLGDSLFGCNRRLCRWKFSLPSRLYLSDGPSETQWWRERCLWTFHGGIFFAVARSEETCETSLLQARRSNHSGHGSHNAPCLSFSYPKDWRRIRGSIEKALT